jgi:hypothetical protein
MQSIQKNELSLDLGARCGWYSKPGLVPNFISHLFRRPDLSREGGW